MNLNQPPASRPVVSNQSEPHPDLSSLHDKHRQHPYTKPVSPSQREAFETAYRIWQSMGEPSTLLDIGCGTGESSRQLAMANPRHLVLGIDQSGHRLSRAQRHQNPPNLLYVRARAEEFWLQMFRTTWTAAGMSFFYPNPWPKKKHVMRRWHAHPIWPHLCTWCPAMILRTNWPLYAQEWVLTLTWMGVDTRQKVIRPEHPLTAFERKYHESGHTLVEVSTRTWEDAGIVVDKKEGSHLY